MGPTTSDSSREECRKILRRMELETYGAVVSTLRAQGELNKDRKKLLEDLSVLMKISPERHKAEIRRAVNDEKLSCIAERVSGAGDTEWAWALEGRRVVPLMPRLVRPTPFTSLASSVSKAITQNPRICLNQAPVQAPEDAIAKYVRDPDDEDTLSPVMVPIASPDSSCHSNNNFDPDFVDTPFEKSPAFNIINEVEKKPELLLPKKPVINPVNPTPLKRPRSPSSMQVVSAPLTKVRAASPNCVRPQLKVVTPQQPVQLAPRGQVNTPVRPQHISGPVPLPANNGKIRIRAPVIQASPQRPNRPPAPQYSPAPINQPRPVMKQVVQIRQPQPQAIQPKGSPMQTPVTVQATVASNIGKPIPGKANVIVLHKNSPMAKTISSVANREGDRGSPLNKANFLPKSVSTPSGTKVTFPSNVRIISVPSSTSGAVNHATIAQKIVSSGSTTTQKNVYLLELNNDAGGKKIILGDIVPASLVSEVNGIMAPKTVVTKEEANSQGILNSSEAPVPNITSSLSYDLNCSTIENQHLVVQASSCINENSEVSGILDPVTGLIYQPTEEQIAEPELEQSSAVMPMDIFSTAIASADINMEATQFSNEDSTGGTRLILTDAFDSPSAKS